MANERPGFLLYLNQKTIIDELTDAEAGILIKALYEYEQNKNVPKLEKMLKIIFLQFKNNLNNDEKKYEEKCAKNKENIENYWKNKKGKNNTNEYERIRMNTNINKNSNRNINTNINRNKNKNTNKKNNTPKGVYSRVALDNTPSIFSEIISCFNKIGIKEENFVKNKVEFHFKNSESNQKKIQNILDMGYTREDIMDVIYLKYDQWIENNDKNKKDMSTYYRPSTILGEKFEEYYEETKMKGIS